MQQITIVTIKNPFDIRDRDTKTVDYSALKTLAGYLPGLDDEIAVSVNGGLVARENWPTTIPAPGATIVVCPVVGKSGGKKNVLSLIAGIALSVVAMGAGSAASGGAWFGKGALQMAGWKFAGYLAAAAVMYVGGTLMNNMSSSVGVDDYSASQTYSWSTPTTQAQQGIPIPITFGTVRMKSPNVLVAHVTTDGDKQYLNLLLCGGEGPVDSITDVAIDDNPIANFTGVDIQYRYGTNDQDVIPNFADSFADQSLNYKLNSDTYATQQITGNAVQGIELTVEFPQGLFYSNDQGGLDNTNVTIGMEYRAVGAVDWLPFAGGSLSVTAASSSAVRRTARIDNLTAGQYEVRCKILSQSGTTSRYINACYWTTLSSIVYDDFVYPNLVLVGIKALAADQLSGNTPNVQWSQTRSKVHVWNPNTAAYEEKPATNAAWACYDLIHMARKVYDVRTGEWVYVVECAPAELLIYDDFVRWAAACDARGLVCNYVLDSAGDMDAAWKPFEAAGRGKVVRRGTKYGCIFDQAAVAVQMFSVGNIKAGTFSLDYLPIEDRANSVEITFNNAQKDYERDTLVIYGDGYDTSTDVDNPTQITLDAITDPATIYREGKYYLRKNKYLVRTCSFEADVDAIACQVGDVILVQHDIPQWGFGGRIVSATTTTLTLDREVTLEAGKTYEITVRLADDSIVKRAIFPQVGTTNALTVATPFDAAPTQYDVYSFGEIEISTKPFTVASITRGADETRKISALEYNEAVYTEATDVPVIDYSQLDTAVAVDSLSLGQETYRQKDGVVVSNVYASWTIPRGKIAKSYDVLLSTDGATFSAYATTQAQAIVIGGLKAPQTYYVRVLAKNELGTAGAAKTESIAVTGKDEAPPAVTNLTATVDPADRTKAVLAWDAVSAVDLKGYRVTIDGKTYDTSSNTMIVTSANASPAVSVVSVDNSGNTSTAATVTAPIVPNPSNVTGFAIAAEITDRSVLNLTWGAVTDSDLAQYEIRLGTTWEAGTVVERVKTNRLQYRCAASGYHLFWIAAVNSAGKYSSTPVSAKKQVAEPSQPTALANTQDSRNKARVILTWTAPAGLDIAGYEISRGGVVVGFVKETTYTDTVTASGTYQYQIRAKSAGGFYSGYANLSAGITIEPLDVTGFTASQMVDNHSKVRLQWDASAAGDLSHYEIREGSTWDGGAVVAAHAVGTYHDVTITEERTYAWWIKAVSSGGKASVSPASFSSLFSMNPTNPTGLSVTTDADDRTEAVISWAGIADADLLEYELRQGGTTWETATVIAITRETRVRWNPPTSNGYTIRLKARNVAKFESDELTAAYTAKIEPSNVTNFVASQNGDNVLLVWDKSPDADVNGYEVRDGATFDNGQLIATGITGTQHQFPVDIEITKRYHIKAINRAGKYSQEAASASVTITSLTPKNIISSSDEIALQTGTATNTVFGESLITFATLGGKFSDYPATKFSDIGGATVMKLANANIVSDGDFSKGFVAAEWKNIAGSHSLIGGNLRVTCSTRSTHGIYYNFPHVLDRSGVYVAEYRVRANRSLVLSSGFTGDGGAYGMANVTPATAAQNTLTTEWQVIRREYTVGADGAEPGRYLFNYGTYTAGDWTEIEWARIYKKTDEGLFLVGQWGGGYHQSGTYLSAIKDIGQIITANLSCEWQPSVLYAAGTSATLEYRTSKDNVTWDAWKPFVPIMATFRYVQIRATLATGDVTKTPEVNRLILKVDVPDTDKVGGATIAAGGTTVSYGHSYWELPFVSATAIGAGLRAEVTARTTTGFTAKVVNALTGADVGGSITWHSKGY